MKFKSSCILKLVLLSYGLEKNAPGGIVPMSPYVCARIQDTETQARWDTGKEVRTKAQAIFDTQKPKHIREDVMHSAGWWEKNDIDSRIEALKRAIEIALKRGD